MTVSTSTNRIEYTGDAVTTAFSFPYYFLANGDLKVYLDGVLQTITTHYTVAGAGVGAGGTVTFLTAPPNGDLVVIYREVAITQSVDYTPNDPFPANTHAAALGDIGRHFPDTDPAYAGISSLVLLRRVAELIRGKGYMVQNLDTTVVAQQPRLAAYIATMVENIGIALDLDPDNVNVKATTTERLGFARRSEGIAAYAVVLLDKVPSP